jgi:hypothetical protein
MYSGVQETAVLCVYPGGDSLLNVGVCYKLLASQVGLLLKGSQKNGNHRAREIGTLGRLMYVTSSRARRIQLQVTLAIWGFDCKALKNVQNSQKVRVARAVILQKPCVLPTRCIYVFYIVSGHKSAVISTTNLA